MSSVEHPITDIKAVARSHRSKLPLYISERRLLLTLGDLSVLNLVLALVLILVDPASQVATVPVWRYVLWFGLLNVVWLAVAAVFDVFDLRRASQAYRSAWNAAGAAFIAGSIYWLIPFLPPILPSRRIFVFALPVLLALSIGVWRWVYARLLAQPQFNHNALVIGAGQSGAHLARAIAQHTQHDSAESNGIGYHILGFIDDDTSKLNTLVENIPVIGTRTQLVHLAQALQPTEIVLAITHTDTIEPDLFRAILDCHEMGVPITTMSSLYERTMQRVAVEHTGRSLNAIMPVAPAAMHRFYLASKRLLDIAIALLGCIVLLLAMPLVWLANRLTDPGDLFYSQTRVGKNGRLFKVHKFRSMVMDAEAYSGAVWATEDDPRITPIGRILRATRIDELPQFWNVLKGEMSLVGPRPERPHFVDQLADEIIYYRVRHAVKPGITGWAQINYRYGASVDDSLIKLQYDLYYIRHQSIRLDLEIMLRTVQVMLGMRGR